MELTDNQQADVMRLKAYFPYRIICGIVDKNTSEFSASAFTTMRTPNKLAREGHKVIIFK